MLPAPRLAALDGLRGLAAVIVVVHHGLLTVPRLADAYFAGAVRSEGPSLAWVLSYTPLHVVWAGTEAVYLFFVLSGIVLVLPVLAAGRDFSWFAYLPRRLVRICLPVAAAVAFGGVLAAVIPRLTDPALGPWVSGRPAYSSVGGVVADILLLFGTTGVVSPLWSLQWELLFSLLLGLFVLWAIVGRRWWWWKMLLLVVVMAAAKAAGVDVLFYLAIFGVGALLVVEWDRIGGRLGRLGTASWIVWTVTAALLTTSRWWLAGVGVDPVAIGALQWTAVVGVAMLILAGAFWTPARSLMTTRLFAWLGRISFSLYLVHEPIIVGARLLLPDVSPLVPLAVSVPLAFLVAEMFSRVVEQPAHRLARRIGRTALEAFRADVAAAPPPRTDPERSA